VKCVEFFFQALKLIRAEMIIQAVWAWRPGRLRRAGGNCWMFWA